MSTLYTQVLQNLPVHLGRAPDEPNDKAQHHDDQSQQSQLQSRLLRSLGFRVV